MALMVFLVNISSVYLYQIHGLTSTASNIHSSKLDVNKLAYAGANFVPIAVPNFYLYTSKLIHVIF